MRVGRGCKVIGWLLIAFSGLLVVAFQPLWELGAPIWFLGDLTTAPSENIDVQQMWFREGRRGRFAVYSLRYEFTAVDEQTYSGVSYYSDGDPGAGRVRGLVEYHPLFPPISRLKGHRVTPGGPWGLLMLVPGLIGVAAVSAARSASRTRHWQFGRSSADTRTDVR